MYKLKNTDQVANAFGYPKGTAEENGVTGWYSREAPAWHDHPSGAGGAVMCLGPFWDPDAALSGSRSAPQG